LIGSHFDDRDPAARRAMARAAIAQADMVIGDLNDMWADDGRARFLRSAPMRAAAHLIPNRLHVGSLASRLVGMAQGAAMREFQSYGFVDADPAHEPTMTMAGVPMVQLDHLMYDPRLIGAKYFVTHRVNGTDHLGISAIIAPV
jgi:hypothetical protein